MILKIKFEVNSNIFEDLVPDFIRFTSSINEETSTITVNFYNPTKLFNVKLMLTEEDAIKANLTLDDNWHYITKDIRIIWVKGKPLILQAVFLLTSKFESKRLKTYLEIHKLLD